MFRTIWTNLLPLFGVKTMKKQVLFSGSPELLNPVREALKKSHGIESMRVKFFNDVPEDFEGAGRYYISVVAHIRSLNPRMVVVDEDATPQNRILVLAARELDIPTLIVQHGMFGVKSAFIPMVADHIAVWGEESRKKLIEWGVPDSKITVTGNPKYDKLCDYINSNQKSDKFQVTGNIVNDARYIVVQKGESNEAPKS